MNLKEKSKTKAKLKFRKVAVIVVLVQVFLYTWVHLILSTIVGMEIAPTTSVAFYTFCGAEAGLLAFLRKTDKDKEKQEEQDEQTESEEQEYEGHYYSEVDEP